MSVAAPDALPAPLTPLLGRGRERAEAARLLRAPDVRLVSMTGPPGIGKSRLAVAVAADLADTFKDGVVFVALAAVLQPQHVLPAVASALKLADPSGGPAEGLRLLLRSRHLLLVLDNFEQVAEAAPDIAGLLAACPHLKVLATSREALAVRGEHELPVPPLPTPDPSRFEGMPGARFLDALKRYPSVELFVQRCQALQPTFDVDHDNAETIGQLCARLEGVPLAIELAAARVKLLPPATMLERIASTSATSRLDLLSRGPRDLPARHQTLRNAIAWSYQLLQPDEQALFRRLAVFPAGCTLDQVAATAGGRLGQSEAVLPPISGDPEDLVNSLASKSLIQVDDHPARGPRVRMLETLRGFGTEQLALAEERDATERFHALHTLRRIRSAPAAARADQAAWLDLLEAELGNLRACLDWLLQRAEPALALEAVGMLWRFWIARGYLTEGREWMDRALASTTDGPPRLRARALHAAGMLALRQSDIPAARQYHDQAARLLRPLAARSNDPSVRRDLAEVLCALSRSVSLNGDYEQARGLADESLDLFEQSRDPQGVAEALLVKAMMALFVSDYVEALSLAELSLATARQHGDPLATGDSLATLGLMLAEAGKLQTARARVEEGLAMHRAIGYRRGIAKAMGILGQIALGEGKPETAEVLLAEGVKLLRALGERMHVFWCLLYLALIALDRQQYRHAARLMAAGEALNRQSGVPMVPMLRRRFEAATVRLRTELGRDALGAIWSEAQHLSIEEVLAETAQPRESSRPEALGPLSQREMEVLALVARGLSDAEAAERLVVSPRTINAHMRSIYDKLGVSSRTAAVHYALQRSLL